MFTRRLFNALAAMTAIAPIAPMPGAIYPGDLPGMYFYPDDGAGNGSGGGGEGGQGGGAGQGAGSGDGSGGASGGTSSSQGGDQDNQANAWRRKAEAAEKRVKDFEKAEQDRKDAELAEIDREKKQRTDAEQRAAAAEAKALKLEITNELGLPKDALDLLTGTDEATIRAQAEKIVALTGKTTPAPVKGGTQTQPGGQQQPTADEKIAAAMKSGDSITAIRLMREKQGIGK